MVDQCHKRGMELHAWINPYRAKTKSTSQLAPNHIGVTHPERVFNYDQLLVLNPGLAENRQYICEIAADILRRYDVDGFHIDDYFYPYPAGLAIPDQETFARHNNGFRNIADWRRDNVNLFIKQLNDTINSIKPWVKFGVSPFGIYRNKKQDPRSEEHTSELQSRQYLVCRLLLEKKNGSTTVLPGASSSRTAWAAAIPEEKVSARLPSSARMQSSSACQVGLPQRP